MLPNLPDPSPTSSREDEPSASLKEEVARLRCLLIRAEAVRRESVESTEEFEQHFRDHFRAYSNQRAWRIMLWIRKGYSLLFKRGLPAFLRFLAATPFSGGAPLDEYEIRFPSLRTYLPDALGHPFLDETFTEADMTRFPSAPHIAAVPPPRKYDVVILPSIDFAYRYQRPQHMASEFAAAGHRVFWISPTKRLTPRSRTPYRLHGLRENLWEVILRGELAELYREPLTDGQTAELATALSAMFLDCGIAASCIAVQMAYWRPVGARLRERFGSTLLYDCMDDWDTFPGCGAANALEERQLIRECDVLIVTAGELVHKFRDAPRAPVLVRNAADFDFFASAEGEDILTDVPRPVIGYFGAIAPWLDTGLLLAAARARPDWSFVLAGDVTSVDVSDLRRLPNVHFLGLRPYAEMPRLLRSFDVCLIPFEMNQVTDATDPVKLYEYFSQGKPVVATRTKELSAYRDLLYLAGDRQEFIAHIEMALRENDPQLAAKRIAFARANTWRSRAEAVEHEIRKTFPLVSILIVTHNSADFVRPCLDSLLADDTWPDFEIIIVDNASTDGTRPLLEAYAARHSRIRIQFLEENTGFAAGTNFAARLARGVHLVMLNADTIVTRGWITRLVRPTRKDPAIGMVAAVTNFAANEVKVNIEYRDRCEMEAFARLLAAAKDGESMEISVAPLFCVLIPRAVWSALGELDEGFGIGMFEDDDYSLRARHAGFRIVAAEDCFIHHFGQGSFSRLEPVKMERVFGMNRERFEKKWGQKWVRHQPRAGVKPVELERRFSPGEFCGPAQ